MCSATSTCSSRHSEEALNRLEWSRRAARGDRLRALKEACYLFWLKDFTGSGEIAKIKRWHVSTGRKAALPAPQPRQGYENNGENHSCPLLAPELKQRQECIHSECWGSFLPPTISSFIQFHLVKERKKCFVYDAIGIVLPSRFKRE